MPIVSEKLGLPLFNHSTLRSYYQKFGMKSTRPDYSYFKSQAKQRNLQKGQYEIAVDLGKQIMTKAYDEIIYIDETFYLQQIKSRCWLRPGMKLSTVKGRGPSITVIGAISLRRGLIHHSNIRESNNAEHFENFLIGLKAKCEGKRVVIILNSLRIHYAKKLIPVYTMTSRPCSFHPTLVHQNLLRGCGQY